jgi:hypothetical protein
VRVTPPERKCPRPVSSREDKCPQGEDTL